MENKSEKPTPEERARIFMQYAGQQVFFHDEQKNYPMFGVINDSKDPNNYYIWDANNDDGGPRVDLCSILVKPLGKISRRECSKLYLAVAKDPSMFSKIHPSVQEHTVKSALAIMGLITYSEGGEFMFDPQETICLCQTLLEMGFAFPYKNWSVDDLVQAGVYKFSEEADGICRGCGKFTRDCKCD